MLVVGATGITGCADAQTGQLVQPSQCGATLDFVPINSYQGTITTIQDREDAVVLINGNCTGTLIAAAAGPVVLTAGHCVGIGDRSLIAFNHEDQPDGEMLITNGTAFEQSSVPDYALIALDALPAAPSPTLLTTRSTELLASIQHPRGQRKVVAEGTLAGSCHGLVYYTDLDTLVGSSGAGLLNQQGYLFAIHTDGNCDEDGSGSNFGWTAERIVQASAYLEDTDIADR